MRKQTSRSEERRVADQAAEWLERLEAGNPEERVMFARWITESPAHLREFLLMSSLEKMLHEMASPGDSSELLRAAALSNVVVLPVESPGAVAGTQAVVSAARPARWRWTAGLATAACLTLLAIFMLPSAVQEYATDVGEHRAVDLPDGSTIYLNARTHIRVKLTPRARDVELLEREALFKDPVEYDQSARRRAGYPPE